MAFTNRTTIRPHRTTTAEEVAVTLTGQPQAVIAVARAFAGVAQVTGMTHQVTDGPGQHGTPVIELQAVCYPAEGGRR